MKRMADVFMVTTLRCLGGDFMVTLTTSLGGV